MKFLQFILISAVLVDVSTAACVSKTLTFCQYGFNQNLNISSTQADWTNPGTLSFIIRSYYLQGIDGLLAVCNARQQFAQCLGDQYDQCMSKLSFVASGESPQDAQSYVGLFKAMEFDCNGGFIQSSRHWPCIATIMQTKDEKLNLCRQTYQDAITKDPSSLCQSSADYETCVRNQYKTVCGDEVSWWSCERTRRGLSIDEDCPMDNCNLVVSGAQKVPSEEKENVEKVFNRQPDVAHVIKSLVEKKRDI